MCVYSTDGQTHRTLTIWVTGLQLFHSFHCWATFEYLANRNPLGKKLNYVRPEIPCILNIFRSELMRSYSIFHTQSISRYRNESDAFGCQTSGLTHFLLRKLRGCDDKKKTTTKNKIKSFRIIQAAMSGRGRLGIILGSAVALGPKTPMFSTVARQSKIQMVDCN